MNRQRFLDITLFASVAVGLVGGCTSSERAQYAAFNSAFRVTVWSGGKPIKEYTSRGKVATEEHSDGWYFSDKATGKLVRVSGTVTMEELSD